MPRPTPIPPTPTPPPEPQPQPAPGPTPPPTPTPAPVVTGALANLTGMVRTRRPNSPNPYGIPWSNVARYEPAFTNAGRESRVDPALIAAMAVVESDANQEIGGHVISRDDGFGDGPSVGIMQVKPKIWQRILPDADPMTAAGNIRLGAGIMAQAINQYGSWQLALTRVYFPQNDPNGTTQSAYVQTVTSLLAEIANNAKPEPPPPAPPAPTPDIDPIRVIVGGDYPPIAYGWLADVGLNYYCYGVGHGTSACTQHTGVDVPVPGDTSLYVPVAGVVDCVGAAGTPRWGEGCGAYNDMMPGGGIGNLTFLLDSGHKLVLGHCHTAFVTPGQRVAAGQKVGLSGGMNGYHVHIECAVNRGGTYWLVEPIAALKDAMAGRTPVVYAERVAIPPVDDTPPYWVVRVTAGSLPVLQRGNMNALPVAPPLQKGETFFAQYRLPGTDGKGYWISTKLGRVPIAGTEEVGVTLPQ